MRRRQRRKQRPRVSPFSIGLHVVACVESPEFDPRVARCVPFWFAVSVDPLEKKVLPQELTAPPLPKTTSKGCWRPGFDSLMSEIAHLPGDGVEDAACQAQPRGQVHARARVRDESPRPAWSRTPHAAGPRADTIGGKEDRKRIGTPNANRLMKHPHHKTHSSCATVPPGHRRTTQVNSDVAKASHTSALQFIYELLFKLSKYSRNNMFLKKLCF